MTILPEEIRSAINNALHDAQGDGAVFDVYATAIKIGETFPDAQIRIDDVVDYIVAHLRGVQAVEISPPGLIVEILVPLDDEYEIMNGKATADGPLRG